MKKLLVTAFEPFGGEKINASSLVLERLPEKIGSWEIVKLTLPVVFGCAGEIAAAKAAEIGVDAVLSLGQAAGRIKITPEYVAINFRDAGIPDNNGQQPCREPIVPGGPDAFFATLPVFDMASAITKNGLPGEVSYSAGTYVCNDLFYSLMNRFSGTDVRVCFMHLPLTPEQADDGRLSLSLEDMASAVVCAIEAIA